MTISVSPLSASPSTASQKQQTDFPKAFLSVSRTEYYGQDAEHQPLELTIKVRQADGTYTEGVLPETLQGHVFIIGPAGSIASPKVTPDNAISVLPEQQTDTVLPAQNGWTGLFNGDGMVYRLDFHQTLNQNGVGKAWLVTRFVKPPAFYADKLTFSDKSFEQFKFKNLGVTRMSPILGDCSQINTAFLPMTFEHAPGQRLMVTNDGNRPYEIDPYSLKTLAPIGNNNEWLEMLASSTPAPFPSVLSSAHPCFDRYSEGGQMFTVNVVRSLKSALSIALVLKHDGRLISLSLSKYKLLKWLIKPMLWGINWVVKQALELATRFGYSGADALYVVRWDGKHPLQRWQLVKPDGSDVVIRQSAHMLGITQKYLIVADTGVKLGPEGLISGDFANKLLRDFEQFDEKQVAAVLLTWLREYVTYPQKEDTYFYIIDRTQFDRIPAGGKLTAIPAKVDGPIYHYTADYDETPEGNIVIHAGITHATDPGEFIHGNDVSLENTPESNTKVQRIAGMLPAGLDVNSPAEIVIDPTTGNAIKVELNLTDSIQKTLYLGLYTYRDDNPTHTAEDFYWLGGGAWKEIMTQFIYDLYDDYKPRRIPLDELLRLIDIGARVVLSRVHIDRTLLPNPKLPQADAASLENLLTIPDHFVFPENYIAGSPQFVPKPNSTGSMEGYVVCTVIHSNHYLSQSGQGSVPSWSDKTELWVFEANNLAAGPAYKLSHAKLNIGLTIHSTWLSALQLQPPSHYRIEDDFTDLITKTIEKYPTLKPQIEQLFKTIYSDFERQA
jgi:hypothetical protein